MRGADRRTGLMQAAGYISPGDLGRIQTGSKVANQLPELRRANF